MPLLAGTLPSPPSCENRLQVLLQKQGNSLCPDVAGLSARELPRQGSLSAHIHLSLSLMTALLPWDLGHVMLTYAEGGLFAMAETLQFYWASQRLWHAGNMQSRDRGLPGSQGGCRAVTDGEDWQVKDSLALTAGLGQEPWAFCLITMRSGTTFLGQRDSSMLLQPGLLCKGFFPDEDFVAV